MSSIRTGHNLVAAALLASALLVCGRPVQAAEPVAAPVRQDFRASSQAMAEATPQRVLRPGSLLNIVV